MKKIAALITAMIALASCTENQMAKDFGGNLEIHLPKNERLVEATWKNDGDLWYLTEPMDSAYVPKTKYFRENSTFGLMEGKVTFYESRE